MQLHILNPSQLLSQTMCCVVRACVCVCVRVSGMGVVLKQLDGKLRVSVRSQRRFLQSVCVQMCVCEVCEKCMGVLESIDQQ